MTDPSTPLPMIVVTGYLGAGKTTFINKLLSSGHGLRITVLVNDFGAISLDEKLILNQEGDVIALANGCMCCQIGGDLYRTIGRILESRGSIDYLVVETSGVADPAKIANIAAAEPELKLGGILTLVDAVHFDTLMGDQILTDTLKRQISVANLLLLTKAEMVNREKLDTLNISLLELGNKVNILKNSDEALRRILDLDETRHPTKRQTSSLKLKIESHTVPFDNFTWQGGEAIDRERLVAFLSDPSLGIFRSKGTVHLLDGKTIQIQKVGETIEIKEAGSAQQLSSIVFIGVTKVFDSAICERRWKQSVLKADEN